MNKQVVYTDEQSRQEAIDANPGLRVALDAIRGQGEKKVKFLIFTDKPDELSVEERFIKLEAEVEELKKGPM